MNYQKLQNAKRLVTYPFRLLFLPIFFVAAFLVTDWTKEWDRNFFFSTIKQLYLPF